jgi:hypothetical protein
MFEMKFHFHFDRELLKKSLWKDLYLNSYHKKLIVPSLTKRERSLLNKYSLEEKRDEMIMLDLMKDEFQLLQLVSLVQLKLFRMRQMFLMH